MAKKTKKQVEEAMGIEEMRPSIELTEKIYPGIKDLKIDEKVDLTIKVKIRSIHRKDWGDKKLCASAEVLDADEE